MQGNADNARGSAGVMALIAGWVAVGVPLLWGVSQTVTKSLALIAR